MEERDTQKRDRDLKRPLRRHRTKRGLRLESRGDTGKTGT